MGAKLVRDRIGEIPWPNEDDKKYLRPVRNDGEHVSLLIQKIMEECGEFIAALVDVDGRSDDEAADAALDEAADLMEAIITALAGKQVLLKLIERMREKYEARGGFLEGLVYEEPRP